jgi:hypothetical protein
MNRIFCMLSRLHFIWKLRRGDEAPDKPKRFIQSGKSFNKILSILQILSECV